MPIILAAQDAIECLIEFSERTGLKLKEMTTMIPGVYWDEARWSRIRKNPERANITANELKSLNDFINQHGLNTNSYFQVQKFEGIYDYMYFAMLGYFKYNPMTELETKKISAGLYRLYRPSLKIPEMYTVGLFSVTIDPKSEALCVEERHIHKGDPNYETKPYAVEGSINEYFQGYMIRKRRRYICFQRNKVKTNPNMLITVFHDEFFDGDQESTIHALGGVTFGTSGSRTYISKVYVERCEAGMTLQKLDEECDYVYAKDLRPSILKNLRMNNGEPFYVF